MLQSTGQCSACVGSGGPAAALTLQGAAATPGLHSHPLGSPSASLGPLDGLLASVYAQTWFWPGGSKPLGPDWPSCLGSPELPSLGSSCHPTTNVSARAAGLPMYCLCVWASQLAPLGTRLTAEGQGGPSTSHIFSPHIASGPYKVAMHLMVRAPNMALTSHPSVSVTDSDKGVCAVLSQAPTLLPPPKKTEPQADHNWRHTRGGRHSRGQQACKHGRFTTQSRAATVT